MLKLKLKVSTSSASMLDDKLVEEVEVPQKKTRKRTKKVGE